MRMVDSLSAQLKHPAPIFFSRLFQRNYGVWFDELSSESHECVFINMTVKAIAEINQTDSLGNPLIITSVGRHHYKLRPIANGARLGARILCALLGLRER